jgi:hypothetical protein
MQMPLPSFIGSRQDWDSEQERQLRAAFPHDEEGFQRAWERRYPVSVAGAIAELKNRGLNVNDDNFALFCDLESLQRIGRNYVLHAADVDRVAETLVAANRLSGLALRRKNDGISYAEEQEGIRHVLDTRRRKAAEVVGVSVEELTAAIRCGGISDPAYKPIDLAEVKEWFSANHDNAEFQQQLQEVR